MNMQSKNFLRGKYKLQILQWKYFIGNILQMSFHNPRNSLITLRISTVLTDKTGCVAIKSLPADIDRMQAHSGGGEIRTHVPVRTT